MSEFIKVLLSLSLSGTLLLLLLFLLKPFYKRKLSKRWQYYIWLVVALRFLLPFAPGTTLVGSFFKTAGTVMANGHTWVETEAFPYPPGDAVLAQTPSKATSGIWVNGLPDLYTILVFLWAAFALIFLVRKIALYENFLRRLKMSSTEVSDSETLKLLAACGEKCALTRRVGLYRNSLVGSPIMTGFFRPNIIIPPEETPVEELSFIFAHELIHYKRRDMFYKWLIQLLTCIHWFNPAVYFLEKEINRACELSCDERIIAALGDSARLAYGETLLSSLRRSSASKKAYGSIALTEGAEQIKERLGAIMNFKKHSKLETAAAVILTLAVCIGFLVIGAYSISKATSPDAGSIVLTEIPMPDTVLDATRGLINQKHISVQNDGLQNIQYRYWRYDNLPDGYEYPFDMKIVTIMTYPRIYVNVFTKD